MTSSKSSSIVDCIMDSFHNDTQLDDYDYRMQVTKECHAFGIHLDDYLEYWPTSERPVYVRKFPSGNRSGRSAAFYARERDEMLFNQERTWGILLMYYVLVRHSIRMILTVNHIRSND